MYTLEKILDSMEAQGMISSAEERAVKRYGIELLFNAAANTIGIMLQGFLLGRPWHTAIFYCTYLLFKKDTGGYHAGSHLGCILQFNCACLALFLAYQYGGLPIWRPGILICLLLSVFLFAPVISEKKKISFSQYHTHKMHARIKTVLAAALLPAIEQFTAVAPEFLQYIYLGLLFLEITVLLGAANTQVKQDENIYE